MVGGSKLNLFAYNYDWSMVKLGIVLIKDFVLLSYYNVIISPVGTTYKVEIS